MLNEDVYFFYHNLFYLFFHLLLNLNLKDFEPKYQQEERELNCYYDNIITRLKNRPQPIDTGKKKKGLFSFFK